MKQYHVTGMSCAACSARVEKAVNAVPGVTSCAVSLLTHSMGVDGTASDEAIIAAVVKAGYGASLKSSAIDKNEDDKDSFADSEVLALKKRLITSVIFLIVLMYFSMGHTMWSWPIPSFIDNNLVIQGIVQLVLTTIVLIINRKFFVSGIKGIVHGSPNMDTLVSLGAGSAYIYSLWTLVSLIVQPDANTSDTSGLMQASYYDSAAMIVTLITVGKLLEARSKGKTTDALKKLIKLRPDTATVLVNDVEKQVSMDEVRKGDTLVVRPGETIPVDGVIIKGESAVNESAITGESMPVDKHAGDHVTSATLNQAGLLYIEALHVGEETTLSKMIQLVGDAAATKAPVARIADKVSGVFVPTVIVIALITFILWLCVGEVFQFALARAISVLVVSCPCALGLATPVAIVVGSGVGARHGILFKTAESLEETGKVNTVALDKTGTITSGNPSVTGIYPSGQHTEESLLELASSLEAGSEHPLGKAIVLKAREKHINMFKVDHFKVFPGNGLEAGYNGDRVVGGNPGFVQKYLSLPDDIQERLDSLAVEGKTPLLFGAKDDFYGIIAVSDTIREDSAGAIKSLKSLGINVVMITGDNEITARTIAEQAGIHDVVAGVLPDGKASVIQKLSEKGCVAMVGDGINDAPALTSAHIGIAVAAGTDVAVDAADIVLMKNQLNDVPAAIRLSRATLRNIHQNLFWAFFYNIIGIPLAAGVFVSFTGWTLSPMICAAAMSLSSFCVVTNALRLNLFDIYGNKHKSHVPDTSESGHTKRIRIKGMHCEHCEATVKKALAGISGVTVLSVSHKKKMAVVSLASDVCDEDLRQAVENVNFKVTGIES